MAALWPERCKALVSVSGYLITNLNRRNRSRYRRRPSWDGGTSTTSLPNAACSATAEPERLRQTHLDHRFAEMELRRCDVRSHRGVLHQSRSRCDRHPRLSLAVEPGQGESQYDDLEQKLCAAPVIAVPTITIASDFDGAAAIGAAYAQAFTGKYSHRIFNGIGHNVPQEAPQAFAKAILDVAGY